MKRKTWGRIAYCIVMLSLISFTLPCQRVHADEQGRIKALEAKIAALEEGSIRVIHPAPWVKVADDPKLVIEGPAFDREGNLYVSGVGTGEIFKITPNKKVTSFFKHPAINHMSSIDIHKDGRLFCCTYTLGTIIVVTRDGSSYEVIVDKANVEGMKTPDDIVFDSKGNFYFTDLFASKVWYVTSDFKTVTELKPRGTFPMYPNGISLVESPISGKEKRLLIAEYKDGFLWRFDIDAATPWKAAPMTLGSNFYPVNFVAPMSDSNAVDADGNVYQCVNGRGIIILEANTYRRVAEVRFPVVDSGEQMGVTNMTIKPGTNEAYAVVSHGPHGAEVYKFTALGKAPAYFSHQ